MNGWPSCSPPALEAQLRLQEERRVRDEERLERFQIPCDLTWGYCDLANKPSDLEGFAEDAEELRSLGQRLDADLARWEGRLSRRTG